MARLQLPLAPPPGPPETRVSLRVLALVDGDVVEQQSFVFCPFQTASTKVVDCLRCADFARVESQGVLICAREALLTDDEALELVSDRHIYSGGQSLAARTPIGAVAENVLVCATPTTLIAGAEAVVSASGSHGVVVVDRARRPTAFVSRASLGQTHAARILTLGDCHGEAFGIFDECDPLASAIDRLIHDRLRAGVTIDADGRVTGLVSDLAVLRWLARAARGHMSHESTSTSVTVGGR